MDFTHNNRAEPVEIQQQTSTGLWQTVRVIDYVNSQYILRQMQFVKHLFPKSRVRAVTSGGQLIDMLP